MADFQSIDSTLFYMFIATIQTFAFHMFIPEYIDQVSMAIYF